MTTEALRPGGCTVSRVELTETPMGPAVIELYASRGMPVQRWADHVWPDPRYHFEELPDFPSYGVNTVNWWPRSAEDIARNPLNIDMVGDAERDRIRQMQAGSVYSALKERSRAPRPRPRRLLRVRAALAAALESLRRWGRRP